MPQLKVGDTTTEDDSVGLKLRVENQRIPTFPEVPEEARKNGRAQLGTGPSWSCQRSRPQRFNLQKNRRVEAQGTPESGGAMTVKKQVNHVLTLAAKMTAAVVVNAAREKAAVCIELTVMK